MTHFATDYEQGMKDERERIAEKLRDKAADLISNGDMGSSQLVLLSSLIEELEEGLE